MKTPEYFSNNSGPALNAQRGAALLVSLILLLLLTIIGISSIEDASLQSNMARNSQFKMQAFNVSFSESNAQYNAADEDFLAEVRRAQGATHIYSEDEMAMYSADNPFTQNVVLNYTGNTGAYVAKNAKRAVGIGDFDTYNYQLDSSASLPNTGTESLQYQGLLYIGPKEGGKPSD